MKRRGVDRGRDMSTCVQCVCVCVCVRQVSCWQIRTHSSPKFTVCGCVSSLFRIYLPKTLNIVSCVGGPLGAPTALEAANQLIQTRPSRRKSSASAREPRRAWGARSESANRHRPPTTRMRRRRPRRKATTQEGVVGESSGKRSRQHSITRSPLGSQAAQSEGPPPCRKGSGCAVG